MKKAVTLILTILLLQLICLNVEAKTVKVKALDDFSSVNPPYSFKVVLQEPLQISENILLYPGCVFNGYIYKVIPPKRLKQDANFVYIPTSYTDTQKQTVGVNNIVATYATKINKTELVVSSALVFTVGLIPALVATTGFFAAEGAIKSKNDKLEASVNSAYEKSYLSFWKKGNELYIKSDNEFLLNIAIIKEQAPNYSYTEAK